MDTIFHKIIRREIPARIHYEDDLCLAFDDIRPQAPVHILLIPKTKDIVGHRAVEKEDTALMGHLILKAKEIAEAQGLKNGWRLVVNNGTDGGQTVDHLHIHILGGRKLNWPPG